MSIFIKILRWDHETPIEESLEALNDVVRAPAKPRCIEDLVHVRVAVHEGADGVAPERPTRAGFVSMQDHLNLLNREEEARRSCPLPAAIRALGVIPCRAHRARSRLARAWDATSERQEKDIFGKTLYTAAQGRITPR